MMNVNMTPARKNFVEKAQSEFGEGAVLSRDQVVGVKEKNSLGWPSWFVRAPYKLSLIHISEPTRPY